jgi:PAS domain S-box-containing protein
MPEPFDALQDAVMPGVLGVAQVDSEGRYVAVNSAFRATLGPGCPEPLGQDWSVTAHPNDRKRAQAAYQLARTTGQGYVEIRISRSDSLVINQAATLVGISDDGGVLILCRTLVHDVTGHEHDKEALRLAIELAPNGLLMLDSTGAILTANRAIETLFGYSREEVKGSLLQKLLPERFRAEHLRNHLAFNSDDGAKAMIGRDLIGLRKDGIEIPLQVYVNRIETTSGELILCTILDVSERVQHQQQLELAKEAAEAANRAKGDFLARMSHEIRTPMNLIMGMSALLLNGALDDKQRQQIEITHRNARRLLRLINGILDLSKVEAGNLTLGASPFDLNSVVMECAAIMAPALEQKGLEFKISVDPDAWLYWIGDAERLQQVLLNLIGNSIKFTDRGSVEVRVRAEWGTKRGLRFEVTDTGCGVATEKATLIFEAFQQAEGSLNRPYEGTGLGLSISKTLVEMMSGRIWVEQIERPGTKFVFTAFLTPSTNDVVVTHAAVASAIVAHVVEPGTRVLIVEDNPENVILLQAYLEGLPLSLHFAVNGVEAVRKRRESDFDLILMDIQMPIMDGRTATREIRLWENENSMPRVPVVALTAHALSSAHAESIDAGCDWHLSKPVERHDLVEAIAKFAKRPALRPSGSSSGPIAALRPAYLANRRIDLAKIRDSLNVLDFGTIQTIGHNVRGTGLGYGFPEIATIGSAIEIAARTLDAVRLAEAIREFERCLDAASA